MTTIKTVVCVAALGLAGLTFAGTRSYNLTLNSATQVGSTQLSAGSYKLSLDGHVATFTNTSTGARQMVLVHFTDSDVNYQHTAIDLINQNGAQRMEAVELEDTNNRVEF